MKQLLYYLPYFFLFLRLRYIYSQAPYLPRFVTPNEYYYDGRLCSELRPNRIMDCPTYGVLINSNPTGDFKAMSQSQIEDLCVSLNFKRCDEGQNLFPDGVCRSCPVSHPNMVEDGAGDLYCNNESTGDKLIYPNPFNCMDSGNFKRVVPNSYRPCAWDDQFSQVDIQNYYKRDDFIGEMTMQYCSLNVAGLKEDDPLISKIVRTENMDVEHGFLHCPRPDIEYSFAAVGWMIMYIGFAIGIGTNIAYYFYKSIREDRYLSRKSNMKEPATREPSLVTEIQVEISDLHKIQQLGFKNDFIGTFAWVLFWAMSFFLHLLMIAINLDLYGMWWNTLCPAHVNEYCNEVGGSYSWRSGFGCSTGCLFSFKHTTGFDNYWPFYNNPGGINLVYGIICTAFAICSVWWLLSIVFYHKLVYFFSIRCSLMDANYIVCIKPREKDVQIEKDNQNFLMHMYSTFEKRLSKYIGNNFVTEKCKVQVDDSENRFIIFQCIKYTYDNGVDEFRVKTLVVANTKAEINKLGTQGLTSEESYIRLKLVGENKINYEVPTWAASIWDQFFAMIYLYQFMFLWMWYAFYYWLLALIIHVVVIITGIITVLVKRSAQGALKAMSDKQEAVEVKRDNRWVSLSSDLIVPGDIIKITPGSQIICDCVLVNGRSVLNESSLTGEPAPVPKLSVPNNNEAFGKSTEDMKHLLLAGTIVESVTKENNDFASALVMSTGINTRQGQLMRSMLFPPRLRFKFDDHFVIVLIILFFYALFVMLFIAYLMDWILMSIFYGLFTVGNTISPLIPAMFTAAQANCAYDLKKKGIFCIEMNRTFVSAKIKTFCFDKTGTLTKQGMEYHGHCNIDEKTKTLKYYEGNNESMSCDDRGIMGCCHELEFVANKSNPDKIKLIGNEIDVAMFEASGYDYTDQDNTSTFVQDMTTNKKFKIFKRFQFNRETMMMTALVEDLENGKFYVYSKGSYERVAGACKESTIPQDLISTTTNYAMKGHYILGIASKEVDSFDGMDREMAESDLNFIGLLHFKNELKEDTPEVLEHIKEGNIRCVMITGDNIYTACSIAKESGLSTSERLILGDVPDNTNVVVWRDISNLEEVSLLNILESSPDGSVDLAVTNKAFDILRRTPCDHFLNLMGYSKDFKRVTQDGRSDKNAMHFLLKYTRIFARMKPDHKVEAVRMNMEEGVTGMCGDGANDAAALRLAHCGIAIATGGGNATIVAPFSSSSHSLKVVTDIIRHGRGTLATAIAGYKRLLLYGQSIVLVKFFMYHASLQLSELTWIIIDAFINVGMALALLKSQPAKRLSKFRPTSSLLGTETILSTIIQILIILITYFVAMITLYQQEFFSCRNFDAAQVDLEKWWTMSDNYESSVLSICALALVNNHSFIFNLGFDYRRWWFKNYYLFTYWLFWTCVIISIILSPPNFITCLFRIGCGDDSLLRKWDELGIIEYDGLPFVPPGCSCSEQVGYDPLDENYMCENEYLDCTEEQYNSLFHHTIFDDNYKVVLLLTLAGSTLVSIFFEWFVIYGPVRQFLRRRKHEAKQMAKTN